MNQLRAVEVMYTNTNDVGETSDEDTQEFNILAEILQGDTLAPCLYIIALDYALWKVADGVEE